MDDREFYERRVREELEQAEKETDPRLRRLHKGWSELYRDRLDRLRSQLTA